MNICVGSFLLSIALLLGSSMKLEALVTGPTPADGDGPASQGCPTCCQGPAAINGIPGLPGPAGPMGQFGQPGSKGDAGEPGQRGEIGPIGAMGEPGPAGNPGPKGDYGIGRPGKIGPRGLQGLVGASGPAGVKGQRGEIGLIGPMGQRGPAGNPGPKGDDGIGRPGGRGSRGLQGVVGATGPAGVKGQKGEPGETPDTSNQRVAFTAVRTSPSADSSSNDARLPFEETVTLLPCTSFDLQTATFTCQVSGTYVFMFSVLKYSGSSSLRVYLRKNGDVVVAGHSNDSSPEEQVSGSAVLVLQPEDTVYLTMAGRAVSNNNGYISFSGFLLYPSLTNTTPHTAAFPITPPLTRNR